MSQMALALDAGISPRHLSFVETGRARPSREVVLALSQALDLPLRERNDLLEACGHSRQFPESPISGPEVAAVDRALGLMLERHEPFGAVVVDRHWNVLRVNRGQQRLLRRLLDPARLAGPLNHMDLMFAPDGLRPFVVNWEEVARALMDRLHREVLSVYGDENTLGLRQRLLAYPSVPQDWARPRQSVPVTPFLEIHLRKGEVEGRLLTLITAVGTPLDVTLQELRIESFFPSDAPTEALLRRLAEEDP